VEVRQFQPRLHHGHDRGLWLGHRSETVSYNGETLYFKGKRVIDNISKSLQTSVSFGSATNVLMSGGSVKGQGSYVLADYVKSIVPSSLHNLVPYQRRAGM
jgi:hypothetical protein